MNKILQILVVLIMLSPLICIAQSRKVLIIGIDGLMPDAVGTSYTPNMNSLFEDGAGILTYGYTEDLTFSGPSWSSIFTGVHHDRHQVITNSYDSHDFSDTPHFLKRLKNHDPALYTAAYLTWNQLSNNFKLKDGTPFGVDTLVFHDRRDENGDVKVTEAVVDLLKNGNPDAVFYYQNDIDGTGHRYGFSVDQPEYLKQVGITDSRIGQVLDALNKRKGVLNDNEEWLIMLVTDHGGEGTGHRGNLYHQRFIPLIISGPLAHAVELYTRPHNVDVSRTVLAYMGVPEQDFSELDGHNMLKSISGPEVNYGINLIFNGDAEHDRGFLNNEIDQAISGWRDQEHTGEENGWYSMTVIKLIDNGTHLRPDSTVVSRKGTNVFSGGSKGSSSKISQILDLSPLRAEIDSRGVEFHMSGFLGGNSSNDRMEFTSYFRDSNQNVLGTAIISGVKNENSAEKAALMYQDMCGLLPPGTASVLFELHAIGTSGDGIDAMADKLSFVLNKKTDS